MHYLILLAELTELEHFAWLEDIWDRINFENMIHQMIHFTYIG